MTSLLSVASKRLEGKVALITGGASGIGEITARLFAHHGAKVLIADIQDDLGRSAARAICPEGVKYVHCDVTDERQISDAVDSAVSTFGRLDIMYNNAAVADPKQPRIVDNKVADFERVVEVNVTGVFMGIKHAARVMIPAGRGGSIICSGSISSYVCGVTSHAYACSKHAVLGLTKNAAVELGQFGIRVNCLSPYALATPLATKFFGRDDAKLESVMRSFANLKNVTLKKEDVANAALFLASEEGRYVSGHNLLIDGGFSIVNPSFGMFKYPEN